MNFVFAVVLVFLAVAGIVVRKTYYTVPVHELKRRAERHDKQAAKLYAAASYGSSLQALLWFFIALTSAGSFVLLARAVPVWASFVAVAGLLWLVYAWLPATKATGFGMTITLIANPVVTRLLGYLYPVLSRTTSVTEKHYGAAFHTGLYERDDLLRLIELQQGQHDSRLSDEELEIAKRALSFDDYRVADLLTPRQKIKTVLADATVGPILIDEVHQSGQPFVLVRESSKGPIVGSLATEQMGLNSNGRVRDLMDATVYYVHENDSLSEAMHAFFVTNHPVFVVVNSFEEFVGVLSVQSMLRQLLGHVPGDDFDQYSNLAAVAARHPRSRKSKKSDEAPDKTDDKVVE